MKKNMVLAFVPLLWAGAAMAECPKGYEHEERLQISAFYRQGLAQAAEDRDRKVREALERYRQEYDPKAKQIAEGSVSKNAALPVRREAEKREREAYVSEADMIHKDYSDELAALRKDSSGRYKNEIIKARDDAKNMAVALHEMMLHELAQLKEDLADDWCGDIMPPWLKAPFNWAAGWFNKGVDDRNMDEGSRG